MSNPPRRSRFQIHLSTAIVLMFTAGALMVANVHGQKEFEPREGKSAFFTNMGEAVFTKYGWPFATMRVFNGYSTVAVPLKDYGARDIPRDPDEYQYLFAVVDAVFALTVIVATLFLCEWLIRRRAARKEL